MTLSDVGTTKSGVEYEFFDAVAPWESHESRLPVVLQHGLGLNRRAWTPWIRRFIQQRAVLAVDLRGHGGSAESFGDIPPTMADVGGDLLKAMARCGVERAHLIGESFGGTACAALAATEGQDRFATLTTCSTAWRGSWINNVSDWPAILSEPEGVQQWSALLIDARFDQERVSDALIQWVSAAQQEVAADVIIGLLEVLVATDLREQMPNLAIPVMNLIGASPFVDPRNGQELVRHVPHAQNVFIPAARHGIVLSHWEECFAAVNSFILRTERGLRDTDRLALQPE